MAHVIAQLGGILSSSSVALWGVITLSHVCSTVGIPLSRMNASMRFLFGIEKHPRQALTPC